MSGNLFLTLHKSGWLLMVIMFIVSYALIKKNSQSGAKVTSMILRLLYLVMLISGAVMLYRYNFSFVFVIKGLLAVVLIAIMEATLGRVKRQPGAKMGVPWLLFIIVLVLVVLIGFKVIQF